MSSNSQKEIPKQDYEQALRYSYNNNIKAFSVDGFLAGKVGHKIEITIDTTTVPNDTEIYTFSDTSIQAPNSPILSQLKLVYQDDQREVLLSAERIA